MAKTQKKKRGTKPWIDLKPYKPPKKRKGRNAKNKQSKKANEKKDYGEVRPKLEARPPRAKNVQLSLLECSNSMEK